MDRAPLVSVIILNFNGERFIGSCLESLAAQDMPAGSFEILVVDNASQDTSMQLVDQFKTAHPAVTLRTILLETNRGYAAGNNAGVAKARGEFVVLLNNDCSVRPDWLAQLVSTAQKDPTIFAVNGKTYLRDTNRIQNAGNIVFRDGYGRDRGALVANHTQTYEEDTGQYNKVEDVPAVCGVAVLYRKAMLDRLGGLDETFFMYYEDVELSERARMHGYRLVYTPHAVVHHHHAASSGEWSPFFIFHSELGRLLHTFFWFPLRVFAAEYIRFTARAKLRILYGLRHPKRLAQQLQYIRVSWWFFRNLFYLWELRAIKRKGISAATLTAFFRSLPKRTE